MSELGELIRKQREKLGLSQMAIARALGYQYSQNVSYYEKGQRKVPMDKLRSLALVLELPDRKIAKAYLVDVEKDIKASMGGNIDGAI